MILWLTLEQHGFELHGFELQGLTYTQIFSVNTAKVLHNLYLVESADAESQIQSANCEVML